MTIFVECFNITVIIKFEDYEKFGFNTEHAEYSKAVIN